MHIVFYAHLLRLIFIVVTALMTWLYVIWLNWFYFFRYIYAYNNVYTYITSINATNTSIFIQFIRTFYKTQFIWLFVSHLLRAMKMMILQMDERIFCCFFIQLFHSPFFCCFRISLREHFNRVCLINWWCTVSFVEAVASWSRGRIFWSELAIKSDIRQLLKAVVPADCPGRVPWEWTRSKKKIKWKIYIYINLKKHTPHLNTSCEDAQLLCRRYPLATDASFEQNAFNICIWYALFFLLCCPLRLMADTGFNVIYCATYRSGLVAFSTQQWV